MPPEGPEEHTPSWSTWRCGQNTAPLLLPGWQGLGPSGVFLVFLLLLLHFFFSSFPECRKLTSQEMSWSNCLLCNKSDFSPVFQASCITLNKHVSTETFLFTSSNFETFRKTLMCHLGVGEESEKFCRFKVPKWYQKGSLHQLIKISYPY